MVALHIHKALQQQMKVLTLVTSRLSIVVDAAWERADWRGAAVLQLVLKQRVRALVGHC